MSPTPTVAMPPGATVIPAGGLMPPWRSFTTGASSSRVSVRPRKMTFERRSVVGHGRLVDAGRRDAGRCPRISVPVGGTSFMPLTVTNWSIGVHEPGAGDRGRSGYFFSSWCEKLTT